MKRKYIIVIALTPLLLFFDQLTKSLVLKRMYLGETIPVIHGFLSWHFLVNPGAAFSLLPELPERFRIPFFSVVSICAIAVIIYYLVLSEDSKIFFPICLAFVLAGALGNLMDRVRFGHVVDFILVEGTFLGASVVDKMDRWFGTHFWPSFNVSDALIVVGIVGMAIDLLFFTPESEKKDTGDNSKKDSSESTAKDENSHVLTFIPEEQDNKEG